MIDFVIKNVEQFKKEIDDANKAKFKAAINTVKVEGFRLKKVLQAEIRNSAPGGKKFPGLTEIAKRYRGGKQIEHPLYRLAIPVRYRTESSPERMRLELGFVGSNKRDVSASWRRIAEKHQEGFTTQIDDKLRERLVRLGSKPTSYSPGIYAPKKTTTMTKTPARSIIDPFWTAHQREADRNIENNFERKMRGERI